MCEGAGARKQGIKKEEKGVDSAQRSGYRVNEK